MTYTSHGYHIPDSPSDDEEPNTPKASCSGFDGCSVCMITLATYKKETN